MEALLALAGRQVLCALHQPIYLRKRSLGRVHHLPGGEPPRRVGDGPIGDFAHKLVHNLVEPAAVGHVVGVPHDPGR